MGLRSLKWDDSRGQAAASLSVCELLVAALAKVDQPWLAWDCEPGWGEEGDPVPHPPGTIQWGPLPLQTWRPSGEGSDLLSDS